MLLPLARSFRLIPVFCLLMAAALPAHAQRGPAPVFAHTVTEIEFSNQIEALGTVTPNEMVELTVNVSDRVTGIYFDDGQRVKAGQTLLLLVQGEQVARVEGAVARVRDAQSVVDRMKPLVEEGGVSQVAYDQSVRDLTIAQTELTQLRIQQKERVLVAPFDGVLGFRRVSKGTYLSPGDVVATLVDDTVMKLDFEVPSIEIAELKPGLEIHAKTDDFPNRDFPGTIQSIDNMIDPVTRSVTVRAVIPNEDQLLRAGTFMNVLINAASSGGLAVPEGAVQPRGPKNFVFVVEEGDNGLISVRREVEIGRRQGDYVEVTKGLVAGDRVVTDGVIRVRDGGAVKITNETSVFSNSVSGGNKNGPAPVNSQ